MNPFKKLLLSESKLLEYESQKKTNKLFFNLKKKKYFNFSNNHNLYHFE